MVKIFISYRRQSNQKDVDLLYNKLAPLYGEKNIFYDIHKISVGDDFTDTIHEALRDCDVLIPVIGENWINEFKEDPTTDWVLQEIKVGLAPTSKLRIIPVLTDNANMPSEKQLPDELALLSLINAQRLRTGADYQSDFKNLQKILDDINQQKQRKFLAIIAGIAVLLIVILFGVLGLTSVLSSDDSKDDNTPQTITITVGAQEPQIVLGDNLLMNPSFSEGLQIWDEITAFGTFEISEGYKDPYGFSSYQGEPTNEQNLWAGIRQTVSVKPNTTYSLSAWMLLDEATGTHLKIIWRDCNDQKISEIELNKTGKETKNVGWMQYEGSAISPDNACTASVGVLHGNVGNMPVPDSHIIVDDMFFAEVVTVEGY